MIFGTLSVDKQLKFMQKYNQGFNKENILVTPVLDLIQTCVNDLPR